MIAMENLQMLMGTEQGDKHFSKYTKNEIILQLGKGSGKDFVSTVACAYVVYKLLCLKDPARYYGKPSGDAIDIINVAINAHGFPTKIKEVTYSNPVNQITPELNYGQIDLTGLNTQFITSSAKIINMFHFLYVTYFFSY